METIFTKPETVAPVAAPRSDNRWSHRGGYLTGVLLALAGLLLAAATAVNFAVRIAGSVPTDPVYVVVLRLAGSSGLVIAGFCLMVLSTRGIDAEDAHAASRQGEEIAPNDDLVCRRCSAANDHLARFCDQCGKRL